MRYVVICYTKDEQIIDDYAWSFENLEDAKDLFDTLVNEQLDLLAESGVAKIIIGDNDSGTALEYKFIEPRELSGNMIS